MSLAWGVSGQLCKSGRKGHPPTPPSHLARVSLVRKMNRRQCLHFDGDLDEGMGAVVWCVAFWKFGNETAPGTWEIRGWEMMPKGLDRWA